VQGCVLKQHDGLAVLDMTGAYHFQRLRQSEFYHLNVFTFSEVSAP
jgi:hypothetical protein